MTRREPPTITELNARYGTVLDRIHTYIGDMPSAAGSGGGSFSDSDRTGNRASALVDGKDLRDVDFGLYGLRALNDLWPRLQRDRRAGKDTTHLRFRLDNLFREFEPPSDHQADGLRVHGDDSGAGWCQSHWRVGSTQPPRTGGSKLCRICEEWVRAMRSAGHDVEFPPREAVDGHARGVPFRQLVRHFPRGTFDG